MLQTKLPEVEQAFFNDGYNIAKNIFKAGLNTNSFIELSEAIYRYIDSFNEIVFEQCIGENIKIKCKKRCDFCCHQSVWILPFEANNLMNHIRRNTTKNLKAEIIRNISEKDNLTKSMKMQTFLHYKHSCPLLVDKSCAVYEARPMACRIYLSLDMNTCLNEFNDSKNADQFPKLLNITLRAGRMLNEGVCKYLSEQRLYISEWLLESQLNHILKRPKIFNEWILGNDSFKAPVLTQKEIDYFHEITAGR